MAAPTYASGCQSCHALQFDAHFAESVPHDDPKVVHDFVVSKLRQYIQQHPQALHEEIRPARLIFGGKISREGQQPIIARTATEWVDLRTKDAETLLWHKTCIQCHTLNYKEAGQSAESTPTVAASNIRPQWLGNSVFSHYAHASFDCKSCHTKALASQETSDVLIPSIKSCQSCHNGEPTKVGQAQNGCFLCHQYHNWKGRDEPFMPTQSTQHLRGTASLREPQKLSAD
jgi:cytochrome c551/c552